MTKKVAYHTKVRLSTPRAVQRLLQRTINQVLDDSMPQDKARTIGYLARCMMDNFDKALFEERIAALEARTGEGEPS